MLSDAEAADQLRDFEADLNSLLIRADTFKRDVRAYPHEEVMSRLELVHALAEAREALGRMISAINEDVERTKAPLRQCLCQRTDTGYDNSACSLHPVNHPYFAGCCEQPEDTHRPASKEEYEAMYPLVFDEQFAVAGTRYRVDARRYPDGLGVTVTRLFDLSSARHIAASDDDADDDGDSYAGLCFDFPSEIVPDLIPVLQRLLAATASR